MECITNDDDDEEKNGILQTKYEKKNYFFPIKSSKYKIKCLENRNDLFFQVLIS